MRLIKAFIDELGLAALGFEGMEPATTGRPAYHPSTMLKIYLYGHLNRVQSRRPMPPSRRCYLAALKSRFYTASVG